MLELEASPLGTLLNKSLIAFGSSARLRVQHMLQGTTRRSAAEPFVPLACMPVAPFTVRLTD